MIEFLKLKNVGPAPEMEMRFGPRLNLITGDNGLGKSFLLDVAWWALTRQWPQDLNQNLTSGYPARPTEIGKEASIRFGVANKDGHVEYDSNYVAGQRHWNSGSKHPYGQSLVLYVMADGGFAVWDPLRNAPKVSSEPSNYSNIKGYVFSLEEVWNGLKYIIKLYSHSDKEIQVCNGLIADWASWIREKGEDAARMSAVLTRLSPALGVESLQPGDRLTRLSLDDARDIPTIRMGYGQDVPILHASLGVRRITSFAYMLSWAWREHRIASEFLGLAPSSRMVVLFDEIEAHLHPRWQRAIVPALLQVMETLTGDASASVQLIGTTHAPLVLASIEPLFDEEQDRLFALDLVDGRVSLKEQPWAKQGDVINWLVSDSFGLRQGYSLEAEQAIECANAWMRGDFAALPAHLNTKQAIHAELKRVLAGHDPFWPRWIVAYEKSGDAA
ncbi:MAG: AAA family ATPase [Magnetococcales bacterium]|nr:AAA family ATPase [Magnetococcales bacterium]